MTHDAGYGMSRVGMGMLAAAALWGCGGSVDLSSQGGAGGGGTAGVAGSGGGGGSFPSAGSGNVAGSSTPGGGAALPKSGILAFDANRDGAGRAIYLRSMATPDCTSRRLTSPDVQAKQAVFSQDGTRMAYAALSEGLYQIHVLELKSTEVEQVTELPYGATAPSFSPDGQKLAFLTGDSDGSSGNPIEGQFDVVVLDLETMTARVVLTSFEGHCCGGNVRAPTFFGNGEVVLSTGTELVGVDLQTLAVRDVMPTSGRIPNPQDPEPAPDGVRYIYADRCDGSLSLFIGRVDGSSGDSCVGATKIPQTFEIIAPSWGTNGYIATAYKESSQGLILFNDQTFDKIDLPGSMGARNPAWAPESVDLTTNCE